MEMMPLGKLEEKKNHKKQKLLDTAFSLFTDKGVNKTSVSDITSKAGVAKGTFYLYFHDKYDIKKKLVERKSAELLDHAIEKLENTGAGSFEDKLLVLLDDILNQLADDGTLMNFLDRNLSAGLLRDSIVYGGSDGIRGYASYLSKIMRESEDVEWNEPDIMIFTIIELVGSSCYSVITYSYPVDLAHYKPYLYGYVREIVKSHQIVKNPEQKAQVRQFDSLPEVGRLPLKHAR